MDAPPSGARVLPFLLVVLASCTQLADDDGAPAADDDDSSQADDDDSSEAAPPEGLPDRLADFWRACEQEPTIPPGTGYDGLLTDTHVHTNVAQDPLAFALALLGEMNATGVDRVVVQSDHFAPPSSRRKLDLGWAELLPWCGRVEFLVGAFDPEDPDAPAYVAERLDAAPYAGVGELDIRHVSGQLSADPDAGPLLLIYADLVARGLSVHLQASAGPFEPLFDAQVQVMRTHPELPFAWLGCTGLSLPDDLPHVSCTLVPGGNALWPPDPVAAAELLSSGIIGSDMAPEGFPTQAGPLLGWDSFAEAMLDARAELGERDLPDEVKYAFARGNFDRTWPDRR